MLGNMEGLIIDGWTEEHDDTVQLYMHTNIQT